jgi:acyl carrier protein phosphodiesterase
MNYLSHLALSYPDAKLIAGNYIGDLITHKEINELHPLLANGLKLHRWIDHYSNNHPSLLEINKAFHETVHKYAPVATDIICDHILHSSWRNHFEISYSMFSEYNYKALNEYSDIMPERIASICKNMVKHQWLRQYESLEGLEIVLRRTNQKTKFPVDLTLVIPVFLNSQSEFTDLFNQFFYDCKKESLVWINLQNETKR